jgi:hypothetical protein
MNVFYYLNFFIYRWYKSKDKDPLLFSFLAPVLLISTNIFCVFYCFNVISGIDLFNDKIYHYAPLLATSLFSYLVLYRGGKYNDVFIGISKGMLNTSGQCYI